MRHRRMRDIVIELTSLLDVVMILIFAVMIKNSQLLEEKNQEIGKLETEKAAMQEKYEGIDEKLANALGKLNEGDLETILERLEGAENQLDAYEYLNDIVVVYNIGLENRYNNTERCLTYGRAAEESPKTHKVKRTATNDWDYAISSLKLDLGEFVDKELEENEEDRYLYLVFSFDKNKVYSNDYDDVEKVLEKLEADHGDRVRYKRNTLGGE